MLGRRTILVLSVLISLVLHAALYWAAPSITFGRTFDSPVKQRVKEFRFHLREEAPVPPPGAGGDGKGNGRARAALSSRPGSVRDLLKREDETLKPDLGGAAVLPVEDLAARAARERLAARPEATPAPEALQRVDAKIVEIAHADARMDLDVPRRVVRPSPERFFAPDAAPALRSEFADPGQPLVRFEPVGEGLLARPVGTGAEAALGDAGPAPETLSFDPEMALEEQLPLPVEIARAPVEREKARAVEETPFQFLDDLVDISLAVYRAQGDDAGYFRVRVKLRDDARPALAPKDVVFLIDASASMQQRKLEAATAGVREALDAFRKEDRFNIALFRDTVTPFQQELVPATEAHIDAARAFLRKVDARGETDVYNALNTIAAVPAEPGRASLLVVLSDGRPTTGVRDARAIINAATGANTARHAVFAYAGGNAIDRYLLELLAYRNRGAASFTKRIEDMRGGFTKFFGAHAQPVLVNVSADYAGLDAKTIFPRELPDLSAAHPYEIHGRFVPARDKEFALRLSGRSGQARKDLVFKLRFDEAEKGGEEIASGWAFQKSYALIAEIAERGEAPELLSELRGLGAKFGIKTVYSE